MLAFVAELAVGIVFDDRNAVFIGQQNELVAASFGKRDARRILKVGQDVHEFRAGAQAGIELVGEQAIVIDRHGDILGSVNVECLQRAEIGGRFERGRGRRD